MPDSPLPDFELGFASAGGRNDISSVGPRTVSSTDRLAGGGDQPNVRHLFTRRLACPD